MKRLLSLFAGGFIAVSTNLSAETFTWTSAPYEVNVFEDYYVEGKVIWNGWPNGYGEFDFYQYTVEYGTSCLAVVSGSPELTVGYSDSHPTAQTVLYEAALKDIEYGEYFNYYHEVVVRQPNRAPTVSLTVAGATATGGGVNSFSASNGTVVTISTTAADLDGNLQRIRVWANFNSQGWAEIRNVAAGSDSFQYALSGIGLWEFHCRSLDNASLESATAVINVTSTNRAATVGLSVSGSSLSLGQSFSVNSSANDADGNLNSHCFWVRGERMSNTFGNDENGWMDGPRTSVSLPAGWSAVSPGSNYSTPQNATSNATSATFTPWAPGYWQIRANASDPYVWASAATSGAIFVSNVVPTNALSAPAQIYVGEGLSITHTANNPTSLGNYLTGFRIHERRENTAGVPYQDWTQLNYVAPAAGNRVWTSSRTAPDRPGRIIYHIRAWNQWMTDGENLQEIVVQVPNRAPSVSVSATSTAIFYGQTAQITATAADPDGNLSAFGILRHDGAWRRPAGIDYAGTGWNLHTPESGWSSASFSSDAASGSSASKTISYLPSAVGTYSFHANGHDGSLWKASGNDWVYVAVNKTTPTSTYGNQASAEGAPLTASQLNAVFTNPHNNAFGVPGTVSYVITAGGVAPYYTNGTALYAGQLLPSGTFTVRASVPASDNYNVGSKDITFNVSANPNADNDGDGISNAVEIALGTNPNVAATVDPAALQIKIHTPRP